MNSTQKIIKYLAIAFGTVLAVNIISWTVWGILTVGSFVTGVNMFSGNNNQIISEEAIGITETINDIDVEIKIANFNIVQGEKFQVILNNTDKNIKVEQKNGTLKIKDNTSFNLFNKNNQKITIYIPEELEFNGIKLDTGIGETNIEKIVANKIDFNLGIGKTDILEIISKESTKIDTGMGKLGIESGYMNNVKLNSGIGETDISCKIIGNSKMDNGIGKTTLNIDGSLEEYSIKANTGIGAITINNEKIKDGNTYGTGTNIINIDGGIGEVQVSFD